MEQILVQTSQGMIPRDELTVVTASQEDGDAVCTTMEWSRNGEMVRRDVWVNMLRGAAMKSEANDG